MRLHGAHPNPSNLLLPLPSESVTAGFPSPADNYVEDNIDLNEELIHRPASTFFLRVKGDSMSNAGILDGDLLIVDRSLDAKPGNIVVAILDGAFTLKKLTYRKNIPYLEAANHNYPIIDLRRYGAVQIWGVAIYSIHTLPRRK
ncbi:MULTISPECIES: LexA family protein [Prochlorococcus]|uniref:UmuD ortholog, peptidase family S24 n=1 Tax=Prochlorococcus marinus (strain SARG / CCMP1375 / SS120) TaxID=167539 RepID=Q7VCI0_PROMA|nr:MULTISPECIES: translesion error-prone DNA polymerase V autoproteolytic subunit [Prochlorococcus]AAP99804.1 UmuD ortholog, peptidase family S24 [Prochlorococcus marinus subsp. marinus str. CCMP1375]KGG11850.1 Error-prone repair protein UmuD [Prochlorococcus marinus str. LG]KGG21843.1 Error-prone repair protein UmuD [Prochlorococcus marinus str. SS2]KGG23726.1 Error-prone repair protein UmuD [Prochlorococcus marinus str. SS35]KGG32038.1 Error-prone repair protein UmuD [Prochlorococcus marinus